MPQSRFASPQFRAFTLLPFAAVTTLLCAQQPSQQFLAQRSTTQPGTTAAVALFNARKQSAAMPQTTGLNAAWQPLGPSSIVSPTFGNLTGRITALAADPNDTTGNTLYVGTTGGGV